VQVNKENKKQVAICNDVEQGMIVVVVVVDVEMGVAVESNVVAASDTSRGGYEVSRKKKSETGKFK
jgi:hypothetical protein